MAICERKSNCAVEQVEEEEQIVQTFQKHPIEILIENGQHIVNREDLSQVR